ncbi:MAG: LytTR family DNA-binding domain-containing protein [Cyclobacteriaceae bacterium]
MITVLIVDDEIEACEGVALLLAREPDFKILGTSRNGEEALESIRLLKPDLVLLDIQMPDKNGFEVLESIKYTELPMVVFITAYDEYALQAFRVHALDYLQKPFTDQRFSDCLDHVRSQVQSKSLQSIERLRKLLDDLQEGSVVKSQQNQLKFRSSGKIYFMDTDDIIWVEGFDYYIKIHINSKFYLVRDTLRNILNQLPPAFIRIHKSAIINKAYLVSLEPLSRGNYQVELKNGKRLIMSKFYKDQQEFL